MKDIYLTNYSVKGIKTLDELVSLSFYKKTITKNPETQEYNIKGIYGTNGSGKSAIISSVDILRNIITDSNYLNNPIVQENLDSIINQKLKELYIYVEYIVRVKDGPVIFRYNVSLSKDFTGKYIISNEQLCAKQTNLKNGHFVQIYEVVNGKIKYVQQGDKVFNSFIVDKTTNLLSTASMSALFVEKCLMPSMEAGNSGINYLWLSVLSVFVFGSQLHVYLDKADDHREYIAFNSLNLLNSSTLYNDEEKYATHVNSIMSNLISVKKENIIILNVTQNIIQEKSYRQFESVVKKLYSFLHIFKPDLKKIEIDKKENKNIVVCDLVMVYDGYKVNAEYESTGIKKLIRLFAYIDEMVQGGIVFIDELDSNLHDVYLCALLEYLMEYGQGQLCFTTHNVGPMDVLKRNKKSIDFLSDNHMIYPWRTNGNYSPSKLYRSGMIEGSPFNVDLTDFISVFGSGAEDE